MASASGLDRVNYTPIYRQLADRLRADIGNGTLAPETRLPTENELCQIHVVSRSTVRGALRELEREGLLRRLRGKGTFVRRSRAAFTAPPMLIIGHSPTWLGHLSIQGLVSGTLGRAHRDGALVRLMPSAELESSYDSLCKGRPGGVILVAPAGYPTEDIEFLERRKLPYVVEFNKSPRLNHIDVDNRAAMGKVVDHLFGLGHRRFALFNVLEEGNFHYAERCEAVAESLAAHGVPLEPSRIAHVPVEQVEVESAYDAFWAPIFALPEPPTAVVCVGDNGAAILMRWLERRGIAVPGRVSVTGFDNSDYCGQLDPPLTTVSLDYYRIGYEAADCVLAQIRDPGLPRPQKMLGLELVVRGSTGPAPAATGIAKRGRRP
jgi:DNA-binding LacI/PurR family transcriptional regulator